jgi:hypothetical protein
VKAAGFVVADMGRLRAALAARAVVAQPRRAPRRVAMTLVPVALAAELALFAFLPAQNQAPARQVVEPRKPDSSLSRRDSVANWKDSVAAILGHVLPTSKVQLAAFDTADRRTAVIWYMRPDTL